MKVEDKTLQALASAIKFRQMRQEVLTANVANSETPGYKSQRLDFEKALARAIDVDEQMGMNHSESEHYNVGNGGFNNLEPEIYEDSNGVVSEDGNTVDRDAELALMAENRLMYEAAVKLMKKKYGMMKYVIQSEN